MKPHNKHAAANIKTGGYGEDTKLDLKNSSWQQRIFDSDFILESSPVFRRMREDRYGARERRDRGSSPKPGAANFAFAAQMI